VSSTLDRLCRALGVSAPDLTQRILDRWPDSQTVAEHVASGPLPKKTKKQADEWRKTGHPRAFSALWSMLPSSETIASLGIDPGRNGAMVGIDSHGAVVLEVALGSLFVDESQDGPAARKRARAEEQARVREVNRTRPPSRQLKGRRKQVTSMAGARWRLDPMALRWLFEHLRPPRVALEGLLFHNNTLTTQHAWGMTQRQIIAEMNRVREGIKSTATMQANWERLAIALRYAGLDYEEVTPSVWQAGWSAEANCASLARSEGWEWGRCLDRWVISPPPSHAGRPAPSVIEKGGQFFVDDLETGTTNFSALEDALCRALSIAHYSPKTRSIAAARLAGYDCGTNDALADAYGLARWGLADGR
jgi:hypothetical protein